MQVTHEGGAIPFESLDGKKVYYQKKLAASDVWQVPVAGGEETRVLGPPANSSSRSRRTGSTSLNLAHPDMQVG